MNNEDLKENAQLYRLLDRAYILIYNNPMMSREDGAKLSDAQAWIKEYRALKNPATGEEAGLGD